MRHQPGLDDYPRASTPSENEEHIDLVSWMMFYSRMMVDIAQLVGEDSDFYARTYHQLETQLEGPFLFISQSVGNSNN